MKAGLLHLYTRQILASFLIVAMGSAKAGELVIPGELENVDGNSENIFPFGLGLGFSFRYQQVYSATEFDPSAPLLITEIRFRPDFAVGSSFDTVLPEVQISLSTTPSSPDLLSSVFADNVGADETIVFDGVLPLSSNASGSGPLDFDVVITLDTPFVYDPLEGDLLLDVRNYGGGGSVGALDANNDPVDSISRVTTSFASGLDGVNNVMADLNDSFGLVTKLVFEDAAATEVVIDVRPGSDENPVNLKAPGKLAVAILTTDGFDASSVDHQEPILLGDPDLAATVGSHRGSLEDVDHDGRPDLLLHFSIAEMVSEGAVDENSQFLGLSAQALDGSSLSGLDIVTIISN